MLYLVVALCAGLLLPALFMDGMFIDGLLYASVSKNYAIGKGTFWYMQFSDTHHKAFHEQPPLMFFLQGTAFKIFGLSLYVERVYCLVAAIINAWLITRAWKIITKDATTSWLPVLFWFVMPVTFWAFTNNVEECTMSVFALLALNAILRALFSERENYFWWMIAGLWILLAGLTKGVQGMFLLSAPFWCWVILKNPLQDEGIPGDDTTESPGQRVKKMILRSFLIACIPLAFVTFALKNKVIYTSFAAYFESRFGKTFAGVTANTTSHFHLLYELLLSILPVLFLVVVFVFAGRKTGEFRNHVQKNLRITIFLAACALSGILPLLVTLEQRAFYLVTALPLVALTCALPLLPVAQRINRFFSERKTWRIAVNSFAAVAMVTVIVITFVMAGQPKRDGEKIAALQEVASHTGENVIVTATDEWNSDWAFLTYAQRFHTISFDTFGHSPDADWQVHPKGTPALEGFAAIPLKTKLFDLYQRKR